MVLGTVMFPEGRPPVVIGLELGVVGGGGSDSMVCVCVCVRSFRGRGTTVNLVWKGATVPGWLSCLANVYTAGVAGRL